MPRLEKYLKEPILINILSKLILWRPAVKNTLIAYLILFLKNLDILQCNQLPAVPALVNVSTFGIERLLRLLFFNL